MSNDYRYAGVHFPNGAEDRARILALPSPLLVMLATEARFHYDEYRQAGKTVIWRGLPRVGKRPAELGWSNLGTNAAEATNLWSEQEHGGEEWFVPYNELDLNYERGDNADDFSDLRNRYHLLASFLYGLMFELRKRLPNETQILFPPFTPDHGDIDNVDLWESAARQYNGLVVHSYVNANTTLEQARDRLVWYLERFQDYPIFVGEWNSPDPEAFLKMLAALAGQYPNFKGATYFIWHWYDAPNSWDSSYNVDTSEALYNLLLHPPTPEEPIPNPEEPPTPIPTPDPPMTEQEVIDLICAKADEYGLDRIEFLGGAIAESALNPQAERYGAWPDVSFGLFQQTVAYADEGDHSASDENIAYIKSLYEDPVHACDVAAVKFKYWRYNPDVPALTAWCAYNWPGSYHNPEMNPNIGNYRQGLARAAEILGASPSTGGTVFGPVVPSSVVLQHNDWSCAVRSTYAALWALSQMRLIEPVSYGDDGPRDVYDWMVPQYDDSSTGLKMGNGSGLVEMLGRHGLTAHATFPASLEAVQAVAGTKPVLLGGIAWNHWVYCYGCEPDGTLMLANPSPGFGGISNELRDSFERLGPFAMVEIEVPQTPQPNPAHEFQFGILEKANELGTDVAGVPVEDEHYIDTNFSEQRSTTGLFVYSRKSGLVTFVPEA